MRTFWPAPPRPTNLVDEFWDQLRSIPSSPTESKTPFATWMLHHPIDVALALTHQYLKGITSADDQLEAFIQFWVPTDAVRRNHLHKMLSKQACWERTSWIPFSQKVQVLPERFAHNAFMFSALVATEKPHVYGHVSGRYTNAAPTSSSFCKNNCRPPIVDGKWLPSEVVALTKFIEADKPQNLVLMTTVRLLRSMILTLLSPSGHVSFVIGIPTIFDNRIGFNCLDAVRREFETTVEVPAWKPHERPEAPRFAKATRGPDSRGTNRGPAATRGPDSRGTNRGDPFPSTQNALHHRGSPYQGDAINTGPSVADLLLVAAVTDHMNSSTSAPDPTPSYHPSAPEPTCHAETPTTSWGSDSSTNCNVD